MATVSDKTSKNVLACESIEQRHSATLAEATDEYTLVYLLFWLRFVLLLPIFELLLNVSMNNFLALLNFLNWVQLLIRWRWVKIHSLYIIPTVHFHPTIYTHCSVRGLKQFYLCAKMKGGLRNLEIIEKSLTTISKPMQPDQWAIAFFGDKINRKVFFVSDDLKSFFHF
jgi:hypothetical protein